MSLFKEKQEDTFAEENDFTSMLLPFLNKEEKSDTKNDKNEAPASKKDSIKSDKTSSSENIEMLLSSISPIDALKKKMYSQFSDGTNKEEPKKEEEIKQEPKEAPIKAEKNEPKEDDSPYADVFKSIEEKIPKGKEKISSVKKGSLYAKCLPYIYDENGIKYEDEKPKYTLESVENIIDSAERAAEEKLSKLYNLSFEHSENKNDETPAEENEPVRFKIGDKSRNKEQENRRLVDSTPTKANTLLDDFSGKRLMLTDDGNTVEIPLKLTKIQTDIPLVDDKTRVIPAIKPEIDKTGIYEDILSHTKPINIKNLPGINPPAKKKSVFSLDSIPSDEIIVDDYMSASDAGRIGTKFKKARRAAYLRLLVTLPLTLIIALFATPIAESLFLTASAASLICLIVTLVLLALNSNIFLSFKDGFSSRMDSRFPLAISGIAMAICLIVQMFSKYYEPEHTILFAVALLFYNLCSYKKATEQLIGFKKVVAIGEKKAVALIDDQNATAHMSRSIIDGEVLAASPRRTNQIIDYVKHTSQDVSFKGRLPLLTVVGLAASLILSFVIGMSYQSFTVTLLSFASLTALCAMPTLALAEMLPFLSAAKKVRQSGGVLCSAASAEKIEEINAVVLSSADIFSKGCITLHNIKPLSSNDIDKTIIEAAAVATAAKSPLSFVLRNIVGDSAVLPSADTIKYEDNLGVSGWVDDHHLHIGNRTLMESHGIRVPSLEVDKKILHRGFFPVYIASDQRACAMLIVKYAANDKICNKLISLQNSGVVLLIDNCDPNITEEMLCDYCGLYKDCVKIMDHHGTEKYKKAVNFTESYSAHAFYKDTAKSFLAILTSSFRLKKASSLLQALHIICSVISLIVFAYLSLNGSLTVLSAATCLLMELASIVISLTGYMITGS